MEMPIKFWPHGLLLNASEAYKMLIAMQNQLHILLTFCKIPLFNTNLLNTSDKELC